MIDSEVWAEVMEKARKANDHYSLTEREQEFVFELAMGIPEGGLIIELGVCHGKTAVVLANVAEMKQGYYVGVDNWSLEGSWGEVHKLIADTGLPVNSWELVDANTHDTDLWTRLFPKDGCQGVDLLLIDAGHDEENVTKDCEVWIPKVKPGGIVIFDDVPSGPGWWVSCHSAVRECVEEWCAEWEMAGAWGKVWAFRKPQTAQVG